MTTPDTKAVTPISSLKSIMAMESVREQFVNAMGENSNLFVASLIDLYGSDSYLQKCPPREVVQEALKAATLKLPINKGLGFAYIVPFKDKQGQQHPQFQIGYRGYIQLAMRTGAYRSLNADKIFEGELKSTDKLTGEIDLSGKKISDTVVGYFAHIETVNGFKKTLFSTKEDMESHAKKYSKAYQMSSSPWRTEFDQMAIKTMIRQLLGKYGVMSVEMADALVKDNDETSGGQLASDIAGDANGEVIDIMAEDITQTDEAPTKREALF